MLQIDLAGLARRARDVREESAMLARLSRNLPGQLRRPLSFAGARAAMLAGISSRERQIVTLVERSVYRHPSSPYRALLRHAGCVPGDFRHLVAQDGVEGALKELAGRGVYLTFDELKGRTEVRRGTLRLTIEPGALDNPLSSPIISQYTSGSGGRPGRVRHSLASLRGRAVSLAMTLAAHGVDRPELVFWWPSPTTHMIIDGVLGYPSVGWFYPVHPLPLPARIIGRHLAVLGRIGGYRFPPPRYCDLATPERMVSWIARRLDAGRSLVFWTMASSAARVSVEATERGLDLRRLTFVLAGEPVTEARRRLLEASGARVIVQYSSVETAGLSYGCATPSAADDVHLSTERYAVVQQQRAVSLDGPQVEALLFTTLSPSSPAIMLNAETGDYARVEERSCGCLLGGLGLRTHISEIRSFEKLTGEGVTLARSSLLRILEDVLPARFGGTSLDYQLAEEEAPGGTTRVVLRVSPAVGAIDHATLRATLLDKLGRGSTVDRYQADVWRNASTVEIRREPPLATRAGKVLPFHLVKPRT